MKKLMSILAVLCIATVVSAQSFTVIYNTQELNANDTITFVATDAYPVVTPMFKNISSSAVTARIQIDPVDDGGMEVVAVCAGECIPGSLSPEVTINAGETYEGCFVDFMTNGGTDGLFAMKIFNTADTTDYVITYIHITTSASIDEATGNTQFYAFPNPASQQVTVQYSLNESHGNIVIYDILGHCVKVIDINNGNNSVMVNTSDLPSGVYMYGILDGRRSLQMKKLVIQ